MAPATEIYVAHQDATNLVVVAPPYTLLAGIFLGVGLASWFAGGLLALVLRGRAIVPRGFLWSAFPMLLAVVIGTPFIFIGLYTARTTHVSIASDRNTLTVQQTLLSIPLSTRVYALSNVQKAVVGVGEGCASLRVVMNNGGGTRLLSCTDRSGYNEMADAINRFLEAHRTGL
ncbi:hypothetical protein [Silvibacterium acidisoli]|uniref:hypothetical protein n=1 Tax=Acidobacteriaceae bacterium ZG23-2 TaxID=2883246 RepID=UPI00406D3005